MLKVPYGMLNYEELIEKLENGYRLPYPKEVDDIYICSTQEVYDKISKRCFILEPRNRADFNEVVEIIEAHLSEEELHMYKATKDEYNVKAKKYTQLNIQTGEEPDNSTLSYSRKKSL